MLAFRSLQFKISLATLLVTAIAVGIIHTVYFTWFTETNFQKVSGQLERALNWYNPSNEKPRDLTAELVDCARRFELSGGAIVRLDRPLTLASVGFPLSMSDLESWLEMQGASTMTSSNRVVVAPWHDYMLGCRPIRLPDGMPGLLILASSMEQELMAQQALRAVSYVTIGGSVLLVFMLSFLVRKRITHSVDTLSKAMGQVATGDLSHKLTLDLDNELIPLAQRYNQMLEELLENREKVRDYQQSLEHRINEAREELRLKEAELMQAAKLASVGELAAGVAHEVNNPIHYIMLTAGLLKDDVTDSEAEKRVDKIIEQARRCKAIVTDLLDYARSGAAMDQQIDLNSEVRSALELIHANGLPPNVNLECHLANDLPQTCGTPEEIHRAVFNVINNAVQAVGESGTVSVTTQTSSQSPVVTLVVDDTGTGMDKETLARAFEPFFTTKPVGKGTGLGLSIAYGIVARHRGRIALASESGEGTTVTITLPVKTASEDHTDDTGRDC